MEELKAGQRYHKSYKRRMYRNKSFYSLDCNDGNETAALYVEPSPEALYLWQEEIEELCAAALKKQSGQKEIQLAKLDKRLAVSKQTVTTYSEIDSLARTARSRPHRKKKMLSVEMKEDS